MRLATPLTCSFNTRTFMPAYRLYSSRMELSAQRCSLRQQPTTVPVRCRPRLQHTRVGNVDGWRRSVRAWMMSGSVGGGRGGRWSEWVSYVGTIVPTLPAHPHNARVAVRRREVRVERHLRREVMQRDALRLEERLTGGSAGLKTACYPQDVGRLLGAHPDHGAQVELLEEGEVELRGLGRAVEAWCGVSYLQQWIAHRPRRCQSSLGGRFSPWLLLLWVERTRMRWLQWLSLETCGPTTTLRSSRGASGWILIDLVPLVMVP